ncbi:MAG: CHASE2 domain-containing protein [Lysobacteraceae bacterium]
MPTGKKGVPPKPNPLERAAAWFIKTWGVWERLFGRTSSAMASRMRFTFYPAATVVALLLIAWDFYGLPPNWNGNQWLSSAEDSLFDVVVAWRPVDPKSSGRVVVAEIDECSIKYFQDKGETGWPWPRDRHADLLTALEDGGASVVGYDVLFFDKQTEQAASDDMLLQVAQLGGPSFYGAKYDGIASDNPVASAVNKWPGAIPLVAAPKDAPRIDLQLPYGDAMARRAGYTNVGRGDDGVLRDFQVWEQAGDWAVPSLSALLAAQATQRKATDFPQNIRLNWSTHTTAHEPVPTYSAVDFLPDAHTPCLKPGQKLPNLKGKVVLVGYVASGINDIKPTPIDAQMPGVEIQAEGVENLISGNWIRMPAEGFKYALSAALVILIGFSFWRGEPAEEVDAVFTATNLALTVIAVLLLTFTTFYFDIFTAVGASVTFFGICRTYLAGMRGRALGNDDHVAELGEHGRLHVVLLILRVSVGPDLEVLGRNPEMRRFWETNEYRRRIRRVLYAHGYGKMHEGLIERKTWLAADFRDVILMICDAPSVEELRWEILHDLKLINDELAKIADENRLEQVVNAGGVYVDLSDMGSQTRAMTLQNTLGRLLLLPVTTSLRGFIAADVPCLPRYQKPETSQSSTETHSEEEMPCTPPSAS